MILTQKHDGGPGHGSGYLAGGGSYVSYVRLGCQLLQVSDAACGDPVVKRAKTSVGV